MDDVLHGVKCHDSTARRAIVRKERADKDRARGRQCMKC